MGKLSHEGVGQWPVQFDALLVAGEGGYCPCAVGKVVLERHKVRGHFLGLLVQLCLQLLQEGIVFEEVQIRIIAVEGVFIRHAAIHHDLVGAVVDGGTDGGLLGLDLLQQLLRVIEAGMEEELLHKLVASLKIVIEGVPLAHQIRMDVALQIHAVDAGDLVVHIPGDQHVQLFLGVLVGVQLAQQPGVEPHPVDVLLGQRRRVQIQGDMADAVHTGHGFDVTDAVLIGEVVYGVGLDLLRQALHGDRLDLGHELGGILLLGRSIGLVHDGLQLLLAHAGLDPRQLLLEGSILLLLFADSGISGGEGVELVVGQPFSHGFLHKALLVLLVDPGKGFRLAHVGEGVAGDRIIIGK